MCQYGIPLQDSLFSGKERPASPFTLLSAEKRFISYHIKYYLEKVHAQFTIHSKGVDIMQHLGITN